MQPLILARATAVAVALVAGTAHAQTTYHSGQIVAIYPDPSDFVVELNVAGRCGSRFFHSRRSALNFREMVGAAYTAFAASRPMGFFVTGCAGDRNITSHGNIIR